METKSYTIAELQAMDDDTLNALAAELRGWHLEEVEEFSDRDWYFGNNSHPALYRTYKDDNGFVCHFKDWKPATDRNQSGALIEWLLAECFHRKQPGQVTAWNPGKPMRGYVQVQIPKQSGLSPERLAFWKGDANHLFIIHGNDARAETVAFCAAMLAISQRLN